MIIDGVTKPHGVLDLLLHQLEPFQGGLAPAQVEGGEDLVVRRGGGVRHVRLVEGLLHLLIEVLVPDVDHRPLPQRGQRLVRGLRGVHPHPGPGRIGQQPPLKQDLVVGAVDRADLVGELGILGPVFGLAQRLGQRAGGPHGGARTEDRVEPGECEPGFVPQEHQVGLDGQALLHHPLDVVDDPVERAVGQQQHLDPVQLARPAQGQQLALDLADRDRPVHRVLVEPVGVQVGDHRAGQHQPVVMGLVAVPVHQHDIARLDQGLDHDLVRRGGSVSDEVGLPGAERLSRQLLGLAQRPGGLQQGVQAAAGGGGLGQEDLQAVEVDHVLDPVRVHDRLAVRDGQRVEHPGRPVAVAAQRAEERGAVPGLDAVQDGQVQLQGSLAGVEDAPEVVADGRPGPRRRSPSSGTGRAPAGCGPGPGPGSERARPARGPSGHPSRARSRTAGVRRCRAGTGERTGSGPRRPAA